MGVGGQRHAPAALSPGKRPGTHWVGPRACLDEWGKFASTWIRSPVRPARSESLYRLSYTGPHTLVLGVRILSHHYSRQSTADVAQSVRQARMQNRFLFLTGVKDFLFSTAVIQALEHTKPPVEWVLGLLPRGQSGRGRKLTPQLHLVPTLRMCVMYLHWTCMSKVDSFSSSQGYNVSDSRESTPSSKCSCM